MPPAGYPLAGAGDVYARCYKSDTPNPFSAFRSDGNTPSLRNAEKKVNG